MYSRAKEKKTKWKTGWEEVSGVETSTREPGYWSRCGLHSMETRSRGPGRCCGESHGGRVVGERGRRGDSEFEVPGLHLVQSTYGLDSGQFK